MEKFKTNLKLIAPKKLRVSFEGGTPVDVTGMSRLKDYPGSWSPAHMLASSVDTCFFLTFAAIAEKARIEILSYESEVEAVVDVPDGRHHEITSIVIRPKIRLKNNEDTPKLNNLFDKAGEYCLVRQSLKCDVKVEWS